MNLGNKCIQIDLAAFIDKHQYLSYTLEEMLFSWAYMYIYFVCYFSKLKQYDVICTKCNTVLFYIVQELHIFKSIFSLFYLQETIVKKFHHQHPHQNHSKKNRDRNRMYVSVFLY